MTDELRELARGALVRANLMFARRGCPSAGYEFKSLECVWTCDYEKISDRYHVLMSRYVKDQEKLRDWTEIHPKEE